VVDSGIVLPALVGQEHAVYSDVVVLLGKNRREQLAVFGVLGVVRVVHELQDSGLVFPLNRSGFRQSLLSV
jgi:hypothetical protein